ncbi:MAG: xylulokinase, partial [Rhodothermales bacterium]|nr:xylulokinase [Rhodothermales bacterium]
TPHGDPYLRASFAGLTSRHSRKHLTRAVLEGVAFGLRDNYRLLSEIGLAQPREVRLSGGGAKSAVWRQIIADVLQLELVTVQSTEGAAYGAALLAGVGVEVWDHTAEACSKTVKQSEAVQPNPSYAARYDETYERFRSLYPALRPLYTPE